MIATTVALALLAGLGAQSTQADSLAVLAARLPESALVVEARRRPADLRESIGAMFARAVEDTSDDSAHLEIARRLATAYAIAWKDSFLVREVRRFEAWPPAARRDKVRIDRIRREGNAAYGSAGAMAAIAIWKRGLAPARSIGDSAGMAALLGNVGAGWIDEQRFDSAETYLQRARSIGASLGDHRVEANALTMLAALREEQGNADGARAYYARSIEIHERIGDARGLAANHNNLGTLAHAAGDFPAARREYERALAINRRLGDDDHAATNLVNLAALAGLDGDFARAESLYRDALATWRESGQWSRVAAALFDLALLELRRGDYREARTALLDALGLHDRTNAVPGLVETRRQLGVTLAAMGDLQGAIDELRRAEALADSASVGPPVPARIALARADLALQLNDFAEAERLYERAERLADRAGDHHTAAAAREGRGLLLLERGEPQTAAAMLEAARRSQLAAGDGRAGALTLLSLADASIARGDTSGARRLATRAASEAKRIGDPLTRAAALGMSAGLIATGSPAAAEATYRDALRMIEDRSAPDVAWRLHAGMATVHHARGRLDDAARELRAAADAIDRSSRSLLLAERRSAFLADKWDVHARLAHLERERSRPGDAFDASERLRARQMLELLGRARIASTDTAAADLVAREQDLRRRIGELTAALEGTAADGEEMRGPEMARTERATRDALIRSQNDYRDLLLEMRERAPRHTELLSDRTATWRGVAERLAPDQALIEYLVSDSSSLAFVITSDTIAVLELDAGRRELARLVEFARGTLEMRGSPRTDTLWREPMRQLHRRLLTPLLRTKALRGAARLVLVPHAELHYLPFAALLDGEAGDQSLVERFEVSVAPSASVWLALGDRRPTHETSGVLAMAPRSGDLPATSREVASIARLVGADVQVLRGEAATEDTFRRLAPTQRVLHLATNGVLNKHAPLFSFVELAADGTHDGRLEVHEVFGLRLSADLVVLSACQTALGSGSLADVPPGDDWIGLTRAFLHAGAASVVATLWPVDDWATAALMERFYERLAAGDPPSRALARAQAALREAPASAHPYYWAGFVLVGGADVRR